MPRLPSSEECKQAGRRKKTQHQYLNYLWNRRTRYFCRTVRFDRSLCFRRNLSYCSDYRTVRLAETSCFRLRKCSLNPDGCRYLYLSRCRNHYRSRHLNQHSSRHLNRCRNHQLNHFQNQYQSPYPSHHRNHYSYQHSKLRQSQHHQRRLRNSRHCCQKAPRQSSFLSNKPE